MEVLGSRTATRASTTALCQRHKLLAVATAAHADDDRGGGASRVEILKLWRDPGEAATGRRLPSVATIPECGGLISSMAWSACATTWTHPLGLLATGLDDGFVHVWDPSELAYEPGNKSPNPQDDIDKSYTLGVFTGPLFRDPSKLSYVSNPGPGVSNIEVDVPKANLNKVMEETAYRMSRDIEVLAMDQNAEGWELVKLSSDGEDEDWEVISKDVQRDINPTGLILKLKDLKGPVHGLAFHHQRSNLLAAGGYGDKLKIYHIDRESGGTYEIPLKDNSQNLFLQWNTWYPALLAATSDDCLATIFDVRHRKEVTSLKHKPRKYSEIQWRPDDVFTLALSSDNNSIQIYDFRRPPLPTHTFGSAEGFRSVSWSKSSHSSILTVDMNGALDLWKLHSKESADCFSLHKSGDLEARWCQAEDAAVIASSNALNLCKLKPPWKG